MSRPKSLLNVAGVSLGSIGIVVCAAAMIILWMLSARLERATESLFARMDRSLVAVRQRVVQTQDRVAAATITTADVETTLRDWTRREADQRLVVRLNAAEKTERLTSALQQADLWLEVAESSVGVVQEMLSIGTSASAPTDSTLVDKLMDEIASLRVQLAEATEFVARIHERITETSEEKSPAERIEQAVQIALRVVATLGSVASRLEKFADRLSVAQCQLHGLRGGTQRWIRVVTIGVTLLILWMAAGQVALCCISWNGMRSTQHTTVEDRPPQ